MHCWISFSLPGTLRYLMCCTADCSADNYNNEKKKTIPLNVISRVHRLLLNESKFGVFSFCKNTWKKRKFSSIKFRFKFRFFDLWFIRRITKLEYNEKSPWAIVYAVTFFKILSFLWWATQIVMTMSWKLNYKTLMLS